MLTPEEDFVDIELNIAQYIREETETKAIRCVKCVLIIIVLGVISAIGYFIWLSSTKDVFIKI